jgi:hypothetical protein
MLAVPIVLSSTAQLHYMYRPPEMIGEDDTFVTILRSLFIGIGLWVGFEAFVGVGGAAVDLWTFVERNREERERRRVVRRDWAEMERELNKEMGQTLEG